MPPPAPGCASCAARDEELAALRRWPASGSFARRRRGCGRSRRSCRSRSASSVSRWPGWSGSSPATAGTPRCPRRGMTPRAASRLASSAAPRSGRKRRNASGASSPARRDQRCAGRSRTTPATTTRRARASAARTWPARPICGVARSFQQLEIPEPSAQRIQHDLHETVCGCGRHHVAARPPGVPDSPVSIGPNLRALAVYLLVFQHVPVERCRELICRRGRGAGLRRVHPLLPAQGRGPGRGRAQADRDADHRRPRRRVRRDHAAGRPGRAEEVRAGRVHRAVLAAATWAPAPWNRSATSASCRTSPASSSPTGT